MATSARLVYGWTMITPSPSPTHSITGTLLPFAVIVFLGYSAVGIPLSTLPVEMQVRFGAGNTAIGIIVGLSAATTLLTRQVAGLISDRRGPKLAVLLGLGTTALTGFAYLASLVVPHEWGLGVLAAGRMLLGLGDSLFTTGVMAWAVTRVGAEHAGKAMAWIGIAMYGALALGAPVGAALGALGGFGAVAIATAVVPVLAIPVAASLSALAGGGRRRSSFVGVVKAIWAQGLGMVLASAGFGTIAAFLALDYADRGWTGAGLALTSFGVGYILVRLLFGGLPDRLGGMRVALASLAIEALGLLLIGLASQPIMALLGTAVTGVGYSMVFPSLGVEAVRRVPASSRGAALGAFLACFDLGLGAGGPVAGLVAGAFGLSAAFVAAAAAAVMSMGLIWTVRTRGPARSA